MGNFNPENLAQPEETAARRVKTVLSIIRIFANLLSRLVHVVKEIVPSFILDLLRREVLAIRTMKLETQNRRLRSRTTKKLVTRLIF